MPVASENNTNNFDIVVKNLRRREVTCLLPSPFHNLKSNADPKLCSSNICKNTTGQRRSYIITKSSTLSGPKKRSKSIPNFGHKIYSPCPEQRAKRIYRKKSLHVEVKYSKRPSSSPSGMNQSQSIYEIPRKSYRRIKSSNFSQPKKRTTSIPNFGQKIYSPCSEKRAKRIYRKKSSHVEVQYSKRPSSSPSGMNQSHSIYAIPRKSYRRIKVPTVPHNPPVVAGPPSSSCCDDSTTCSTLSQFSVSSTSSSQTSIFDQEGLNFQLFNSCITKDSSFESSTVSVNNQDRSISTPKRPSRKRLYLDYCRMQEEDDNEIISEYELQRQKRIEENLKLLREILGEDDCNQSQAQETPRIRKSYGRVPLPPPRPKSARIERMRCSYPGPTQYLQIKDLD